MSRYLSPLYKELEVYTPGEQPQDMEYIKLNTNESPYPPSDGVIKAVNEKEICDLRLYSDPECKALRRAIADLHGVKSENVYVSNGSDDILNFAFMAFARENGVVFPDISYGFYKVFAELYGIRYREIPLDSDFSVVVNDYINAGAMVVIANPNAPTGKCLSVSEIERIVSSNQDNVVLIDEAYVDFGAESCYELIRKYKNLLVVQTFSKSRSMAGARLGFAFGDKELIDDLRRIKFSTNPYNVNRLTLTAGRSAIEDDAYYKENCKRIIKAREYTENALRTLGFFVIPSYANFVFAKSDRISGEELYKGLKARGILVRHFSKERIKDFNRITVGRMEDMEKLVLAVKEILGEKI